ncbi:MAG: RNA polymerase sigma factor [Patescibacteria group bacterium]|nr:RNA polymerase sigma factor [Patescibacteria group bacterium]
MKKLEKRGEFIEAFNKYNTGIFRYLYLRSNFHKETAQDLAQEVFVKAWKHRGSYNSRKATIKTWLFTITKNTLVDFYRKNRKVESLEDTKLESILVTTDSEDKILYDEILKKLKVLSSNEQELIILRFIEGFEISEIAKMINKNYTAAKIAILRALDKLKELISHEVK